MVISLAASATWKRGKCQPYGPRATPRRTLDTRPVVPTVSLWPDGWVNTSLVAPGPPDASVQSGSRCQDWRQRGVPGKESDTTIRGRSRLTVTPRTCDRPYTVSFTTKTWLDALKVVVIVEVPLPAVPLSGTATFWPWGLIWYRL